MNSYPFGRWIKWGALVLIAVIMLVSFISAYNGLTSVDQVVQQRWSQVENQMQRRADVINNLVETVKGYVKQEDKIFTTIANANSVLSTSTGKPDQNSVQQKFQADDAIRAGILTLIKNYPEIKSSEQFSNLQTAIEGSENRVAVARKDFIDSVQVYNTKVTRFPSNIIAKVLGYSQKDYFKASPDAQQAPKVEF
jgi:LemA protein